MAKTYKWTIEIEVSAETVADGFDITDKNVDTFVGSGFPCQIVNSPPYDHPPSRYGEVVARVKRSPDALRIATEQGYKSLEHKKAMKG